ncbi:MAG: hypothetical protein M8353_10640 [ANME-2 cluster archaeon]|nr:hypothetical protein [ANME-2 cluster archaeon]
MDKVDSSQFQGYLVGQVIAASVGALLLALEDFGGFYSRNYYLGVETYGYIYLGSGVLTTVLILMGLAGLLISFRAAIISLQAKDSATFEMLEHNARTSMKGAGFTVLLSALGAIVFAISSTIDETDWWLDGGFYGAFIGGLLVFFFGKLILDRINT